MRASHIAWTALIAVAAVIVAKKIPGLKDLLA
jgi:hypothetical protein